LDTGRARANWRASINHPVDIADDSTNWERAIADAAVKVEESKLGDALWLSNSLPYIHRLEYDGWSMQAPAGMVRINMARVRRLVKQELRKLR
jgi:hypothetical protein